MLYDKRQPSLADKIIADYEEDQKKTLGKKDKKKVARKKVKKVTKKKYDKK